jgi:hypothetical protein
LKDLVKKVPAAAAAQVGQQGSDNISANTTDVHVNHQ